MGSDGKPDSSSQQIPIIKEDVTVAKRTVETAQVRVRSTFDEREQLVSEQLFHQEVDVKRVGVGQVVEAIPEVREEEDLLVIPIVEERLVVRKELVLVEELHIRRRQSVQQVEEPVTLRKTRVEVERTESDQG